jgi:toxin-antitoxin system PIN domain toxin
MIAVDTNILVYAHRADSQWHGTADRCLTGLAEGTDTWAIPWPCVHEFLAIVTHPRIYNPPTSLEDAVQQVGCWLESPTLVLLGEVAGYWDRIKAVLLSGKIAGPQVHDARVAALCLQHGVTQLWTADRDFARFPSLTTQNPLVRA